MRGSVKKARLLPGLFCLLLPGKDGRNQIALFA